MKRTWGKGWTPHQHQRFRKSGFTPELFAALLEVQAGLCAVCCEPMVPGKGTHADHCHTNKEPRALLCSNCNLMLGHARDAAVVLDAGAAYLRAHG